MEALLNTLFFIQTLTDQCLLKLSQNLTNWVINEVQVGSSIEHWVLSEEVYYYICTGFWRLQIRLVGCKSGRGNFVFVVDVVGVIVVVVIVVVVVALCFAFLHWYHFSLLLLRILSTFISGSVFLRQNIIAIIEGSKANTITCTLSTLTSIPLIRLQGNSRPFDQCEKAVHMSAGYRDYAHATLDILNTVRCERVALVFEGKTMFDCCVVVVVVFCCCCCYCLSFPFLSFRSNRWLQIT